MLGVIPSLIAVISLLGLAGQGSAALTIVLEVGERVVPRAATNLVRPLLESTGDTRSGWGVALGVIGALYATSRYVRACGRALNRVYGVREGRPEWRLESQMIATTVTIGVMVTGLFVGDVGAGVTGGGAGCAEVRVGVLRIRNDQGPRPQGPDDERAYGLRRRLPAHRQPPRQLLRPFAICWSGSPTCA